MLKLSFIPAPLQHWAYIILLEPIEHDHMKISRVTHASTAQRGEHQIQMAEIPGSVLTGVIFCCWNFFCFHKGKPMRHIPLFRISAIL